MYNKQCLPLKIRSFAKEKRAVCWFCRCCCCRTTSHAFTHHHRLHPARCYDACLRLIDYILYEIVPAPLFTNDKRHKIDKFTRDTKTQTAAWLLAGGEPHTHRHRRSLYLEIFFLKCHSSINPLQQTYRTWTANDFTTCQADRSRFFRIQFSKLNEHSRGKYILFWKWYNKHNTHE